MDLESATPPVAQNCCERQNLGGFKVRFRLLMPGGNLLRSRCSMTTSLHESSILASQCP